MNVIVVGERRLAAQAALDAEPGLHLIDPPDEAVLTGGGEIGRIAAALRAFEERLGSGSVDRVVLVGESDLALAAVLVASKMGIPVAAIATDAPKPRDGGSMDLNRRLIEQLADAVLADDAALPAWLATSQPSAPSRREH